MWVVASGSSLGLWCWGQFGRRQRGSRGGGDSIGTFLKHTALGSPGAGKGGLEKTDLGGQRGQGLGQAGRAGKGHDPIVFGEVKAIPSGSVALKMHVSEGGFGGSETELPAQLPSWAGPGRAVTQEQPAI